MKKTLSIIVALCFIFSVIALVPVSAEEIEYSPDVAWYDVNKTEFVISTPAEFLGIELVLSMYSESFEGKTIKLANNIYLNEGDATTWATAAPVNKVTPIGNATIRFAGTFDGQGYGISGVYISGNDDIGLFGQAAGATFKNFFITNSYIKGGRRVAAIVGRIHGTGCTFTDIYVDAIVSGNNEIAGFTGDILGYGVGSKFENCTFAGTISGDDIVGGIVARDSGAFLADGLSQGTYFTEVVNCVNTGTITATKSRAGGVVGEYRYGKVDKCVNLGTVVGPKQSSGIAGLTYTCASITNSYSCTDVLQNAVSTLTTPNAIYGDLKTSSNFADAVFSYENCVETTTNDIKGEAAKTVMTMLDFNNTWTTVADGAPALKVTLVLIENSKLTPPVEEEEETEDTESNGNGEENSETADNSSDETDDVTESEATTEANAQTDSDNTKSGCGSSIGAMGAVVMGIAICGATFTKKRKEQ